MAASILGSLLRTFRQAVPPSASGQVRGYYVDWRMLRDLKRRKMAYEYADERLRINSLRKNTILPKDLQEKTASGNQLKTMLIMEAESRMVAARTICRGQAQLVKQAHAWGYKEMAGDEIAALPRDSCPVRIRNRCVMTSRPRGVKRRWRLSRIVFRHLADHGLLSGVQRAIW